MRLLIISPEKFAAEFNQVVPGAYRSITVQDIRDLTECGLIGKYGYYGRADLETVRAVLQYEQLRQNRQKKDEIRDSNGAIHCRRCGTLLTAKPNGKRGRPSEYCTDCEPFRGRERNRKWQRKMLALR
ncbi:MAG TPA: hypothetical protein VMX96_03905 [Dehalococcoidia bacterium]|nr:hypothetical protein [Dehalococcoidia bacterium]